MNDSGEHTPIRRAVIRQNSLLQNHAEHENGDVDNSDGSDTSSCTSSSEGSIYLNPNIANKATQCSPSTRDQSEQIYDFRRQTPQEEVEKHSRLYLSVVKSVIRKQHEQFRYKTKTNPNTSH
jgi:hypothetical protein